MGLKLLKPTIILANNFFKLCFDGGLNKTSFFAQYSTWPLHLNLWCACTQVYLYVSWVLCAVDHFWLNGIFLAAKADPD